MSRRSYGTGSLFAREDGAGHSAWYGKWRSNGRQVKRRIGPARSPGLHRTQRYEARQATV